MCIAKVNWIFKFNEISQCHHPDIIDLLSIPVQLALYSRYEVSSETAVKPLTNLSLYYFNNQINIIFQNKCSISFDRFCYKECIEFEIKTPGSLFVFGFGFLVTERLLVLIFVQSKTKINEMKSKKRLFLLVRIRLLI